MQKKMLIISTILLIIAILFMSFQYMVKSNTDNTLNYKYKIEQKYGEVEIRIYDKAILAKIELTKGEYKEMSSKGFRVLADYIFGNNSSNEQISMTSPVVMEMNEKFTMEFIMPSNYDINTLPTPKNSKIEIYEKPSWKAASITFGGFANDEIINEKTEELRNKLNTLKIDYKSNFKFFGYNPPFQLINRKNEIVVEIN